MKHLTDEEKRREARKDAVGEIIVGILIDIIGLSIFFYINTRMVKPFPIVDAVFPLILSITMLLGGTLLIWNALAYLLDGE